MLFAESIEEKRLQLFECEKRTQQARDSMKKAEKRSLVDAINRIFYARKEDEDNCKKMKELTAEKEKRKRRAESDDDDCQITGYKNTNEKKMQQTLYSTGMGTRTTGMVQNVTEHLFQRGAFQKGKDSILKMGQQIGRTLWKDGAEPPNKNSPHNGHARAAMIIDNSMNEAAIDVKLKRSRFRENDNINREQEKMRQQRLKHLDGSRVTSTDDGRTSQTPRLSERLEKAKQ